MLKNIKAVLFDLDGTLVDSMWIWKSIDIEYLGGFGIELPGDLQSCIEGMSFTETAEYMKMRFQIPDSVEIMKETWNRMAWEKYTKEVKLKEGALSFLQYCKKYGIKLGIATSNSKELVTGALKALDVYQFFDAVVTGCEVEHGKPAPDVYLEAAKRCKVLPKNCLVFEDIIAGIKAGKAAGMLVCAIEDAYSAEQKEEKRRLADFYINDYRDII